MNILITGYPGQDATYLLKFLNSKHKVHLLTRNDGIRIPNVNEVFTIDFRESKQIANYCLSNDIEVIVNCAAISSVRYSWDNPQLSHEINGIAVERLLSALMSSRFRGFFYQLGSTDMYGETHITDINQKMKPWSPYGESKAYAHKSVNEAAKLGMQAYNLVLTNHDSVFRPKNYIIRQIAGEIQTQIKNCEDVNLGLGNPNIIRDWAHALDICRGIQSAIEKRMKCDLIFATGISYSILELIQEVSFRLMVHIEVFEKESLRRDVDFPEIRIINPNAAKVLGWSATFLGADTLYSIVKSLNGEYWRPKTRI